jgi:hypothetical protein
MHLAQPLYTLLGALAGAARHRLYITASAKAPAGAGDDDRTYVLSAPGRSITSPKLLTITGDNALSRLGRLRVNQATPSSTTSNRSEILNFLRAQCFTLPTRPALVDKEIGATIVSGRQTVYDQSPTELQPRFGALLACADDHC